MKTRTLLTGFATVAFLSLGSVGWAVSATTDIVGVVKYTIATGSPGQTTAFFPLTESPTVGAYAGAALGRITGVTLNTVSVTGAGWVSGELANPATPFLLRIASGTGEGTTWEIDSNSADTLTLFTNTADLTNLAAGSAVVVGDLFEIIPAETLASQFGLGTTLGGGTSATTADVVWLFGGATWNGYYFNTIQGHWVGVVGLPTTNRNNFIVRPDAGALIYRRGAAITLTKTGRVAGSDLRAMLPANTAAGFVGGFPREGNLNDFMASVQSWWVSNSDVALADRVFVFGGAAFSGYYHDGANWKRVGLNSTVDAATTIVMEPSRPLLLQRAAASASPLFMYSPEPN